ncbi:hypothetical protein J132_08258 [Termitomyces sp. J132]|nr:hypothetical protein H2248_007781 [Termitomyces sp. 'cryptogamus']KNZ82075.1 hypothetical protein J132_08258 [Termitomyces sp. J132]
MSTNLLLTHLQKASPNVPLQTIVAALAHHLSVDLPTPTPLTASVVSSPYFLASPPTNERLQGLVTAFRHAFHLKHRALVEKTEEGWSLSRAIFSKGVGGSMQEWVRAVVRGLQGGRAAMRLACCTGLLLGVKDFPQIGTAYGKVEDEVIIALAEVMDDYNSDTGDWEKEFRPQIDEPLLSLTLILASQSLPLLPKAKLTALPLSPLTGFLTSTIAKAFHEGMFLRTRLDPSFEEVVQSLSTSPAMHALAGLSKLVALTLELLIETSVRGVQDACITIQTFQIIASRIEQDWRASQFASVRDEEELPSDTKDTYKSIWLMLKTLLFSIVMVSDSALGSVVYVRPQALSSNQTQVSSHTLAKSVLQTLSHLSFVVSRFGGVTATATGDSPGFVELRKVFYIALDVLSAEEGDQQMLGRDFNHCESFVKDMVIDLGSDTFVPGDHSGTFQQAKTAYTLACIEQLVPSLGVSCLEDYVWRLCTPYLSDPSHRETYESAHSVVLSIFSSHAQLASSADSDRRLTAKDDGRFPDSANFVHRMVPFYAQTLVQNSQDGRLSTAQLRLAYSALVRSASTSGSITESHRLGWYCITLILDVIRELSLEERQGNNPDAASRQRLHRLHLTLISTISSLPLPLMIRALEEVRSIITKRRQSDSDVERLGDGMEEGRKDLVDALFVEISEKVGEQEKEAAMRWWYTHRRAFFYKNESHGTGMSAQVEEHCPNIVPRL